MKRIIFVDDEPNVLHGLERMLHPQRKHWEMTFLTSGEAALAALEASPADVIVSDMRMPKMDGTALLTAVQERFPAVVRIVLSGHTELEAALRAVPVAHLFLTKPCDATRLYETIERACSLQGVLENEALKSGMSAMTSLPSLPQTYTAITRALADPDAPLTILARTVEQDMAMCARVLRLVNSGFFGLPRQVSNMETAVRLLGTNMLKSLVLSVEVFGTVETGPNLPGFSIAGLQRHSLLAASIARRLLTERREAEDAFMAALLHDVGMLVLATRRPEDLGRALATAQESGRPLHEVEAELGGVTHAQVGAFLLGLWSLPYPIVEAVAHHHDPGCVDHERFDVLAAVHVANTLAHEHAAADGRGIKEAELDLAYLEKLGVTARIPAWRAMAAEQAGAVAA